MSRTRYNIQNMQLYLETQGLLFLKGGFSNSGRAVSCRTPSQVKMPILDREYDRSRMLCLLFHEIELNIKKKVVQVVQIRGRGRGQGNLDKIQKNNYFFLETVLNRQTFGGTGNLRIRHRTGKK